MTSPAENTQTTDRSNGNTLRVIDGSRFWAVVIGIDAYPTERDVLHGCVSDATKFFGFLKKNMGVPQENIELFLGRPSQSYDKANIPPTRANIVDKLLGLSTNDRIHFDDNIIIYYAGHGAVYHCENHPAFMSLGSPGNKGIIEALCPMDRGDGRGIPGTNDDIKPIPDISDRELHTNLNEICRTKGHHITVILDCCHSSSQTRYIGGQIQGKREVRPLSEPSSIADMFSFADKRLGGLKTADGSPRYKSISAVEWLPKVPLTSHVILAACKAYEYATEAPGSDPAGCGGHGVFTQALLSSLERVIREPADLNGTLPTYRELVKGLPLNDGQHPVIAGKCMDRPLWYMDPNCSYSA